MDMTIAKIIGVTDAAIVDRVEDMMRLTYPSLSNISPATFRKEAKLCYEAILWEATPEGQAYLASLDAQYSR